jgi:hypothetical protein
VQQPAAVDRVQININKSIAIGWTQCNYKSLAPATNFRSILIGVTPGFFLANHEK